MSIRPFDCKYVNYGESGTCRTLYPIPHGPAQAWINGHEQYTLVESRFTVVVQPLTHSHIQYPVSSIQYPVIYSSQLNPYPG